MIHIEKELVGQDLPDTLKITGFSADAVKKEKHVNRKHLETSERRVRYIPMCIKGGLPRRCHDLLIKADRCRSARILAAAEQFA